MILDSAVAADRNTPTVLAPMLQPAMGADGCSPAVPAIAFPLAMAADGRASAIFALTLPPPMNTIRRAACVAQVLSLSVDTQTALFRFTWRFLVALLILILCSKGSLKDLFSLMTLALT